MAPKKDISDKLLQWGQAIRAIANNGLDFATDKNDRERYQQLEIMAAEMLASINGNLEFDPGYARKLQNRLHKEIYTHLSVISDQPLSISEATGEA